MGKVHRIRFTADVLEALLLECLEKLARSLSVMCWDMNFREEWLSDGLWLRKWWGATCFDQVLADRRLFGAMR